MATQIYERLMEGASGDLFDAHLLASTISHVYGSPIAPALGLSSSQMRAIAERIFPHSGVGLIGCDGSAPQSMEEPDLRELLLEHRTDGNVQEEWFAHIIARRSLGTNHLWQDLGLPGRTDLGKLMRRHFAPLAQRNDRDMRWKKFFYRELCQRDGLSVCKSPNCDDCCDFQLCFGPE